MLICSWGFWPLNEIRGDAGGKAKLNLHRKQLFASLPGMPLANYWQI